MVCQYLHKLCKKGQKILFSKYFGYTNGFSHLKTYLAEENNNKLYELYFENLEIKQKIIGNFFTLIQTKNPIIILNYIQNVFNYFHYLFALCVM